MEGVMLNDLEFHLTAPTSNRFAERFIRVAGHNSESDLCFMTDYIMELTLQQSQFLQYRPSLLAASALFLSLYSSAPAAAMSNALTTNTYDLWVCHVSTSSYHYLTYSFVIVNRPHNWYEAPNTMQLIYVDV
jgi:hypothetical protein